jgi:hypothetical protein
VLKHDVYGWRDQFGVWIQKQDVPARGHFKGSVVGFRKANILRTLDEPNLKVAVSDHFERAVKRSVVNDDDFRVDILSPCEYRQDTPS